MRVQTNARFFVTMLGVASTFGGCGDGVDSGGADETMSGASIDVPMRTVPLTMSDPGGELTTCSQQEFGRIDVTALQFAGQLFAGVPDYEPVTPAVLADSSDWVGIGTVVSIREGRSTTDTDLKVNQTTYSVVVEFAIQRTLKGEGAEVFVEYELQPEWHRDLLLSCAPMPSTPYLLYLTKASRETARASLVFGNEGGEHSADETLYSLTGPQGIVVEGKSRLVPAVDPERELFDGVATTFDELVQEF